MKKIILILSLFLSLPAIASEETWITKNIEGRVILTPEHIVIIEPYDVYNTTLWIPGDNVVITNSGYIINTDNREKAEIREIEYR